MVDVFLGIGSNIEPEKNIKRIKDRLVIEFPNIVFSRTFESAAVGFDGESFHNLVAKLKGNTLDFCLEELVEDLKLLEDDLGRQRGDKRFSDRTVDIDILLYGDLISRTPIQLPRDEILDNAYVLWPLSEMAPQMKHPGTNKTYASLWASFDQSSQQIKALG